MPESETIKHVVEKGDNLWNIVKAKGFPPKDWEKIYNASYNKKLKKDRPDPNVIQPGDIVYLPRSRPQDLAEDLKKIVEIEKKIQALEKQRAKLLKVIKALDTKQKLDKKKIAELEKEAKVKEDLADSAYDCANSFDWREIAGCGIWGDKTMAEVRELEKQVKEMKKKSQLDEKTKKQLIKQLEDGKRETDKLSKDVAKEKASLQKRISNPYE